MERPCRHPDHTDPISDIRDGTRSTATAGDHSSFLLQGMVP